jgi:hypothetical protein
VIFGLKTRKIVVSDRQRSKFPTGMTTRKTGAKADPELGDITLEIDN